MLLNNKSFTIRKPVYFLLNRAIFVRKMHLLVVQQKSYQIYHAKQLVLLLIYISRVSDQTVSFKMATLTQQQGVYLGLHSEFESEEDKTTYVQS